MHQPKKAEPERAVPEGIRDERPHTWKFGRDIFISFVAAGAGVSEPNLRESIEDALDETEEEGAEFSLEERHMLRNLLGFRDVRVDDVMVPRADISAIDLATSGEDVLAVFVESGHSRLPVYRETLDSPVGMLHLKDVIAARRKPAKASDIEPIMRDVLFVPPSMPALDLLLKMQATRTHLALVIDEYGGTDGLVTIEDLIEEIVGDIEDEHDDVGAAPLRQTGPGVWRASARVFRWKRWKTC